MRTLILSTLLHYANCSPIFTVDREVYDIKKKILQYNGDPDGFDLQHIKKPCWTCEGTGTYTGYTCEYTGRKHSRTPEPCRKCSATGVYDEFWTLLARYRFGKYLFHVPETMVRANEKPSFSLIGHWFSDNGKIYPFKNYIEGKIKHDCPPFRLSEECSYWLLLLFNFRAFKAVFGKIGYPGFKTRVTPMVILGNMAFNVRGWWKRLPYRLDDFVRRLHEPVSFDMKIWPNGQRNLIDEADELPF